MSDITEAPTTEPSPNPVASLYETPATPEPQPALPAGPPDPGPPITPETADAPQPSAEPESPDPEAGAEPEGEEVTTLAELTEMVGEALKDRIEGDIDPEWINGLKVPVKVNGQESQASLKDLVDSYQMREASEKRLTESKAKAKEIIEAAEQKAGALDSQFAIAAELIKETETRLNDDIGNVDWAKLRQDDPAEYAAKRDDFEQRRKDVNGLKQKAIDGYRQGIEQAQQEALANRQKFLQQQGEALLNKVPEWKHNDLAKSEKTELTQYLASEGFSDEEIGNAADHRLIVMARKAMLYERGKSRSEVQKKKVVKTPRVIKPGAKQNPAKAPKPTDAASILYPG